jgi:hypothetical protein
MKSSWDWTQVPELFAFRYGTARSKHQRVRLHILEASMNVLGDDHVVDGLLALLGDRRGFCWTDAFFKMSAVGSLSVSPRGRTDNAFSRRAGHTSVSALDVRTGRLQWGTAVHWREHHKIEYKLEASLRQVRPRRLGGCHLPAGRLPPH